MSMNENFAVCNEPTDAEILPDVMNNRCYASVSSNEESNNRNFQRNYITKFTFAMRRVVYVGSYLWLCRCLF